MTSKRLLGTVALCIGSSLLAATMRADDQTYKPTSTTISASQLIHSRVLDQSGQKIGDLEDIIVDQSSGRAQFGIVKLSGDLADNGKYTPVPFSLLQLSSPEKKDSFGHRDLILQTDRSKLLSASRFSTQNWPDPNHPTWGPEVYRFYGVNWDTAAAGSTGSSFSSNSGTSYTATASPRGSEVVIQQAAPSSASTSTTYQNPSYQSREYAVEPYRPIDNGTGPDGRDTFRFHPRPWPYSELQAGGTGPAYSSTAGASRNTRVVAQSDTSASSTTTTTTTSANTEYNATSPSASSDARRVDDSVIVVQTRGSNGSVSTDNSQVSVENRYPGSTTSTTYTAPSATTTTTYSTPGTTTYRTSEYHTYGSDKPIDNGTGPDGRDTFHFTPRPWPYQDTTDAH